MRKTLSRLSLTDKQQVEESAPHPTESESKSVNKTLDTLKFYDYSIPEGHDHDEISDSVILNSDEEKDQ